MKDNSMILVSCMPTQGFTKWCLCVCVCSCPGWEAESEGCWWWGYGEQCQWYACWQAARGRVYCGPWSRHLRWDAGAACNTASQCTVLIHWMTYNIRAYVVACCVKWPGVWSVCVCWHTCWLCGIFWSMIYSMCECTVHLVTFIGRRNRRLTMYVALRTICVHCVMCVEWVMQGNVVRIHTWCYVCRIIYYVYVQSVACVSNDLMMYMLLCV